MCSSVNNVANENEEECLADQIILLDRAVQSWLGGHPETYVRRWWGEASVLPPLGPLPHKL